MTRTMIPALNDRRIAAIICGSVVFGLFLYPGYWKTGNGVLFLPVTILMYVAFISLTYWYFSREPADKIESVNRPRPVQSSLKMVCQILFASQLMVATLWAAIVYYLDSSAFYMQSDRIEFFFVLQSIGICAGLVVMLLSLAFGRK